MDPYPTLLDPVWGFLVRLCARLPGGNAALWTGWLAAGFGALCVALAAALMMRVRYPIHDAHDPDETGREATARGIAGLASGLFLMLNVPFWIMSTRSLPGTFHLAMLLSAAWLFSEYQRTGRTSRLYLLGLLYGVGIVEFATFWVFAPLAALLVARAMLQRAEFSVRVLVRTGLCVLPGLLLAALRRAPWPSLRRVGRGASGPPGASPRRTAQRRHQGVGGRWWGATRRRQYRWAAP